MPRPSFSRTITPYVESDVLTHELFSNYTAPTMHLGPLSRAFRSPGNVSPAKSRAGSHNGPTKVQASMAAFSLLFSNRLLAAGKTSTMSDNEERKAARRASCRTKHLGATLSGRYYFSTAHSPHEYTEQNILSAPKADNKMNPTFAQKFSLGLEQPQLDFVDITPDADTPLFIDPFALSVRKDLWSERCHRYIAHFFQTALDCIHAGDQLRATHLLNGLTEPNETCLGLSRGRPRGRGVSGKQALDLYDSLSRSQAAQSGILEAGPSLRRRHLTQPRQHCFVKAPAPCHQPKPP